MTGGNQECCFNFFTMAVLSLLLHSSEHELCLHLLVERLQSASEKEIKVFLRMIFYTYHLEVVNDDDCRKLFIDVWRMIPTVRRSSITQTDMGVEFLSVLIRDNFPFLLEKEAFMKIAKLTSLDLNSSTSDKKI
ncbi:hypothetical protein AVEN_135104-1 [Araneus ventricosus]|uniref:Condensin complex subunit 1 C-terminal domain-containing protein n=1 Tax=Araneus ventricosus TaxID=182803 RepID=A0A4Y2JP23_ARAVE|nr:hypothetical protein AVEN_135104-1 [Araneus ventricosus]